MAAVAAGGVVLLGLVAGSTLTDSFAAFAHLDWPWLPLGLVAEAASMAAFARSQRRLLKVGGTPVHLGSVMAVTYAGNAISVSLPLAGPEVSTAFTFRQFNRHGVAPAVAAWALAVSGMVSSFAFAIVLAGGAITSGSTTAGLLGLGGAAVSILPSVCVLAALRYQAVRRFINRLLARLIAISRTLIRRPGPGAEQFLEHFLDRIASLRLPPIRYAEVFALAVWNWVADCLCLACAIRATGSAVPWQGLFLAYGAGMTAGSIGLTPGRPGHHRSRPVGRPRGGRHQRPPRPGRRPGLPAHQLLARHDRRLGRHGHADPRRPPSRATRRPRLAGSGRASSPIRRTPRARGPLAVDGGRHRGRDGRQRRRSAVLTTDPRDLRALARYTAHEVRIGTM